jgi:hypothetical protein
MDSIANVNKHTFLLSFSIFEILIYVTYMYAIKHNDIMNIHKLSTWSSNETITSHFELVTCFYILSSCLILEVTQVPKFVLNIPWHLKNSSITYVCLF